MTLRKTRSRIGEELLNPLSHDTASWALVPFLNLNTKDNDGFGRSWGQVGRAVPEQLEESDADDIAAWYRYGEGCEME